MRFLLGLIMFSLVSADDTVYLKNGETLSGHVVDQGDKYEVDAGEGIKFWFDKKDVVGIKSGHPANDLDKLIQDFESRRSKMTEQEQKDVDEARRIAADADVEYAFHRFLQDNKDVQEYVRGGDQYVASLAWYTGLYARVLCHDAEAKMSKDAGRYEEDGDSYHADQLRADFKDAADIVSCRDVNYAVQAYRRAGTGVQEVIQKYGDLARLGQVNGLWQALKKSRD